MNSCAQIVPPQGGSKDVTPPKLVSVTPADSLLSTRVNKIEMKFDEFITLNNPASEITLSPILPFPLDVSVVKKTVVIRIPDSLLEENTTYRVAFGKAIQDVHEGNIFAGYSYIFSTGNYFDSLQLNGYITNAATGLGDTGALIMLYDATKSDSAVVREKPRYAVAATGGNFSFKGLPDREFKIYALKDANGNMIYDGAGEMIAFSDSIVRPTTHNDNLIRLNLFAEDTSKTSSKLSQNGKLRPANKVEISDGFNYTVSIDTTDIKRRTKDITTPVQITFSKEIASFNMNRINLSYDSSDVSVEAELTRRDDTTRRNVLLLQTDWKENTIYTLRILKGFAQDTAGTDAMPSRYIFRTKRDEDYAKLHLHLPSKYAGSKYLFVVLNEHDTIYQRSVKDTIIHFLRLQPGNYQMRIIVDKNENGKWDSGHLLEKLQPEEVIPYTIPINLKAGWENMIDFEQKEKLRMGSSLKESRDAPK